MGEFDLYGGGTSQNFNMARPIFEDLSDGPMNNADDQFVGDQQSNNFEDIIGDDNQIGLPDPLGLGNPHEQSPQNEGSFDLRPMLQPDNIISTGGSNRHNNFLNNQGASENFIGEPGFPVHTANDRGIQRPPHRPIQQMNSGMLSM